MPKKNWRKPRHIPGTIFDGPDTSENIQRRCGFFYSHGVNPAAVAKGGTSVESIGDGKVRVYYQAIYMPEGQTEWPQSFAGHGPTIPNGLWCEHGGYKKRHKVKQIRSLDALLSEVL